MSLLAEPIVTTSDVIEALRDSIPSNLNVPIFDEFPSDPEKVRYGIYVGRVYTSSRELNQLGIQYCGAYYNAIDELEVVYVSFQQDPNVETVVNTINNLVTYKDEDGTILFDGYFSRTHTLSKDYGPTRAEVYTWNFNLTRLEFNT